MDETTPTETPAATAEPTTSQAVESWLDAQDTPAEAAPAPVEEAAAPDDASGGDTPADEAQPGDVPYSRFHEAITERNQLREQLGQLQPFDPIIQTLRDSGIDPSALMAEIAAMPEPEEPPAAVPAETPADAPDPDAAFNAYLSSQGVDPENLDYTQWTLAKSNWAQAEEARETLAQIRAEKTAREKADVQADMSTQMAAAKSAFPVLQKPNIERRFWAQFAVDAPRGITLADSAKAFAEDLESVTQERLTTYAANKQADAAVPVTAGGGAPSPAPPPPNMHDMHPVERQRFLESYLEAQQEHA